MANEPKIDIPMGDKKIAQLLTSTETETGAAVQEILLPYNIVLVHDGTNYPPRPESAPAGHVTYIGPTQPTTWLSNDQWVNNA